MEPPGTPAAAEGSLPGAAGDAVVWELGTVWRTPRRLSHAMAHVAFAAAVGPPIAFVISAWLGKPVLDVVLPVGAVVFWGGTPLAILASLVTSMRRRVAFFRLTLTRERIVLLGDRERALPRGAVLSAHAVPGASAPSLGCVEIGFADDDLLTVELPIAECRHLVDALSFGPDARRFAIRPGGPRRRLWQVVSSLGIALVCSPFVVVFITTWTHWDGLWILAPAFILPALLLALVFERGRVVVGDDGVTFDRPLRSQFVRVSDIEQVFRTTTGLTLRARTARGVKRLRVKIDSSAKTDAILSHVGRAITRHKETPALRQDARVARNGKSLPDWREALRRLVTVDGGYRSEAVSPDVLLSTATDAGAPDDQRLGAALALGLGDDDEAKARVRVAAEAVANDRLRVAMAHAAQGHASDEELEEATRKGRA
jgi:hypothetical protein